MYVWKTSIFVFAGILFQQVILGTYQVLFFIAI